MVQAFHRSLDAHRTPVHSYHTHHPVGFRQLLCVGLSVRNGMSSRSRQIVNGHKTLAEHTIAVDDVSPLCLMPLGQVSLQKIQLDVLGGVGVRRGRRGPLATGAARRPPVGFVSLAEAIHATTHAGRLRFREPGPVAELERERTRAARGEPAAGPGRKEERCC